MTYDLEKHRDSKPALDLVLESLHETLPNLAKDLIASTYDISDPLEQPFFDQPDDPAVHSPEWHQYGILTHSKRFLDFIKTDAPILLEHWGLKDKAEAVLSEKIDDLTKAELLQIASLLHDLGKFTARKFEYKDGEPPKARFIGHEEQSGAIIRSNIHHLLQNLGLTAAQIEYIALCAEHHFDLGRAREIAKTSGGYTLVFARSDNFKQKSKDIMAEAEGLALEVGLMFMADSLSKTEVASTAQTDEAIAADKPRLEQEIKDRGLHPDLINQALQQPVNIEIGKTYLQQWALH